MNNFAPNPKNIYSPYAAGQSVAGTNALMQRVSYLLCTALLVTAGAGFWASQANLPNGLFLPLMIGTFVCVFAMGAARRNPTLGLVLLYVLSVLEGLLLGPMLGSIARNYAFGAAVIGEAAVLSAVIMAGLGSYVWISGKDFGGIGKFLIWALVGLIVVGLLRFFISFTPGFNLIYAIGGAALFAGFALYDFSNIKHRYGPNDYVAATVGLYLDFLNLFLFLIQILMALSGGGSSRRN